jgi:hypothetical protein
VYKAVCLGKATGWPGKPPGGLGGGSPALPRPAALAPPKVARQVACLAGPALLPWLARGRACGGWPTYCTKAMPRQAPACPAAGPGPVVGPGGGCGATGPVQGTLAGPAGAPVGLLPKKGLPPLPWPGLPCITVIGGCKTRRGQSPKPPSPAGTPGQPPRGKAIWQLGCVAGQPPNPVGKRARVSQRALQAPTRQQARGRKPGARRVA